MDCLQVLRRLHEIERAIGVLDYISVKKMLIEMEDYVLRLHKESVHKALSHETRVVAGASPQS